MAQSPYPQQLTLSQCLDNLRNASLHVLQHEHVSDDAKSFIGELIGAILGRVEQTDSPLDDLCVGTVLQGDQHHPDHLGGHSDSLVRSGQVRVDPITGLILISNPSSGKTLTCTAGDLIDWAKRQGYGDL